MRGVGDVEARPLEAPRRNPERTEKPGPIIECLQQRGRYLIAGGVSDREEGWCSNGSDGGNECRLQRGWAHPKRRHPVKGDTQSSISLDFDASWNEAEDKLVRLLDAIPFEYSRLTARRRLKDLLGSPREPL